MANLWLLPYESILSHVIFINRWCHVLPQINSRWFQSGSNPWSSGARLISSSALRLFSAFWRTMFGALANHGWLVNSKCWWTNPLYTHVYSNVQGNKFGGSPVLWYFENTNPTGSHWFGLVWFWRCRSWSLQKSWVFPWSPAEKRLSFFLDPKPQTALRPRWKAE